MRASSTVGGAFMWPGGSAMINGDGDSAERPVAVERRGLSDLRTTLDALRNWRAKRRMTSSPYGVLNNRELRSRLDVPFEQHVLSVGVEARSTLEIATTVIFPTATRSQPNW
ncbi:MAG: hypothetical protein ACLPVY_02615 [Acidimicrobiia bacterium]